MNCPTCGYLIDAATIYFGSKGTPAAGDLSICFRCGQLLVYTDASPGSFRAASADEEEGLSDEERRAIDAAQDEIRSRGRVVT